MVGDAEHLDAVLVCLAPQVGVVDVQGAEEEAHHVPAGGERLVREVGVDQVREHHGGAPKLDALAVQLEVACVAVVAVEDDEEGEQADRGARGVPWEHRPARIRTRDGLSGMQGSSSSTRRAGTLEFVLHSQARLAGRE